MTKKDLVDIVKTQVENCSQQDAEYAVSVIINSIKTELKLGGKLEIRGFGTLSSVIRKQKIGRNIGQNTEVIIPEHMTIKFKASRDFQKELN